MQAQVGHFSSRNGPGNGRLACVWAVSHIVHSALQQWITKIDSARQFVAELNCYFGRQFEEQNVPAGGIIVSPTITVGKRACHGHIGLLGDATGTKKRLIYSNSSRDAQEAISSGSSVLSHALTSSCMNANPKEDRPLIQGTIACLPAKTH